MVYSHFSCPDEQQQGFFRDEREPLIELYLGVVFSFAAWKPKGPLEGKLLELRCLSTFNLALPSKPRANEKTNRALLGKQRQIWGVA